MGDFLRVAPGMFGPPIKPQQELGSESAQVQKEGEMDGVKGGGRIGSHEQH